MGVYTRPDSPFYWIGLERKGRRVLREATRVPAKPMLKRQALLVYYRRMSELAKLDGLIERSNGTPRKAPRVQRSPNGWCYIYIVQQGELVKIGRTKDPTKRLSSLQVGNGNPCDVLALIPAHPAIETAIQDRFGYLRQQGEWFALDASLSAFIKGTQQGLNPIALLWNSPTIVEATHV